MSTTTQNKSRPALFSAEMVRALLDGRKTQTRRPVKIPQLDFGGAGGRDGGEWDDPRFWGYWDDRGQWRTLSRQPGPLGEPIPPPLGVPADTLWVRETFQPMFSADAMNACGEPDWDRIDYETGKGFAVSYPATDGVQEYHDIDDGLVSRCKPSIHMPGWASRITLKITDVWVERVQSISEADAMAEGLDQFEAKGSVWFGVGNRANYVRGRIAAFQRLWASIYGDDSWSANPWVWAYKFKVINPTEATR